MKTLLFKSFRWPLLLLLLGTGFSLQAQHSVARQWNEIILQGIRNDFARPTVHARNLYHTAIAMYDAWAAFDAEAQPFFLGQLHHGFACPYMGIATPTDLLAAQEEAISYAAYRLIEHRFGQTPGYFFTLFFAEELLTELGYDKTITTTDYRDGSPAALGNYIAAQLIRYGLQDGSNEANKYENQYYSPVNSPLTPDLPSNYTLSNPNRWQPLGFELFIDQSGQIIGEEAPSFLSPEWGQVNPFALQESDATNYERDGFTYKVYHDPGMPPLMNGALHDEYVWGFQLVALWSSHLDPADSVMWDISPASLGNISIDDFPRNFEDMRDFYNAIEGGDPSIGHSINPSTGQPYEPQMVPRGDYARVLAEFWADGPDSETPPGHWFTILNYVNDHPELERKFEGQGPELSPLEWDVKGYFALGGAMHDAAISAWGIKGYYDYPRPISIIRYLALLGQSSDPTKPSYNQDGLPLVPGLIELVEFGDPLEGDFQQHVNKIKVKAWRGPDFIGIPEIQAAGVDWILVENWWPYQRPTFVTPPFAGYVSGHSTYSRAAAEVLTMLTGDPFFPGGMGEFMAEKNRFLVFEEGPSKDIMLQWATYRDASDQTSLSRIWGGIHPPADDIPGRLIGEQVGIDAFALAKTYFDGQVEYSDLSQLPLVFPNPVQQGGQISVLIQRTESAGVAQLLDLSGRVLYETEFVSYTAGHFLQFPTDISAPGLYIVRLKGSGWEESRKVMVE